ncbi:MAG: PEP-CTERM sorting domain-containing protein [Gammaproteobacteria bacterium]
MTAGMLLLPIHSAMAGPIIVDDYTLITGATFIDIGLTGTTGASGGGVVITGTPPSVGVLGLGASANPSPSDPGDGNGWAASSSVVLDFDIAIAGFGVSFLHFLDPIFDPFNSSGILEVFDMSGGTGNLIGSVSSSGGVTDLVDFVGIWSDSATIRSAVLSVPTGSFAVDGYAVTHTQISVPEPTTLVLFALGLVGVATTRRRLRA